MLITIKQILVVAFFVMLALSLLLYVWQRKMIYLPDPHRPNPALARQFGFDDIFLTSQDGLSLRSWYKAAQPGQPTVLYFQGNAGNIAHRLPLAEPLLQQGIGMFLMGYRGYGGNPGAPSEQGHYADARQALAFLQTQGVPPSQIVLYGESLGTGVASELAQEQPFCALILQSPFLSLVDLARWHYPWILLKPWDRYDSFSKIKKIHSPLLIVHGKRDNIVPFAHAQSLYAAANEPKRLLSYPERGHNDLWHPDYYAALLNFITQHCTP
ncbi:MAG: alpha/beta hydrolase [Legionellaceae bacterium]|nr:alpha/beta hydrolase [Legionellaceae bacterium]